MFHHYAGRLLPPPETLDDNGKMLYLTLEKAPQLTGLGPWMGVVQGERQVDSDYPEEKKVGLVFTMFGVL